MFAWWMTARDESRSSAVMPLKSARLGSNAVGMPIAARIVARSVFVSIPNFGSASVDRPRLERAGDRGEGSAVRSAWKSARSSGTMIVSASEPPT